MKEQIDKIRNEAIQKIKEVKDLQTLNEVRVKFLGKKGELTSVLRGMGNLSAEERQLSFDEMLTIALETAAQLN